MIPRLDPRAAAIGAAAAGVVAIPVGTIGILVDGSTGLNVLLFVLIVAAFVFGGFVGARRCPAAPFTHGIAAVLALTVVVEAIGAIRRLAIDDPQTSLAAVAFRLLLATTFGMLGAAAATSDAVQR